MGEPIAAAYRGEKCQLSYSDAVIVCMLFGISNQGRGSSLSLLCIKQNHSNAAPPPIHTTIEMVRRQMFGSHFYKCWSHGTDCVTILIEGKCENEWKSMTG